MEAAERHGLRRLRFLIASGVVLLVAAALFGLTGYAFASVTFVKAVRSVAEFDEHELRTVSWDEKGTPFLLTLVEETEHGGLPSLDVQVRHVGGGAARTRERQGRESRFGRTFLHVMVIEPDAARTPIEIVADVTEEGSIDGRADFVLFQDSEALMARYVRWATSWWAAGGAALLVSFGLLLVAVFWRGRVEV